MSTHPLTAKPEASQQMVVRLEEITKVYGKGDTTVYALAGVNLTIGKGEYCAIMGASGSGKSTMMNVIGCLDRPTTGRYYLENLDVSQLPEDDLARIRNLQIGFVFQQFHLLPQLSALENAMLPMVYAGIPSQERRSRAEDALIRVGLKDRMLNKPTQLSGGQQQRVAIARALVNRPLILLADEPTGALDSHTTQEVMALFSELHQAGIAVIMVTHEADVARLTERIVWVKDGAIVHHHLAPDDIQAALAG
ncbi:MAG: ABC transporter ATP-binding protein [Jaaginema sp. PMC 1079.18]|nr:ABC transporter ATP-binding protein [Jaaginema sp. PMC 1080.18]MEC4849958.1 ABC transporter ATP-binding protein [Jaaginema sp. PMC 1079.18]MEC4866140.1 ABC transporter ATP-binding protein [Jaaginema sp. PMC 1078.18]